MKRDRLSEEEILRMRRFLTCNILYQNAQRESAVTNMTGGDKEKKNPGNICSSKCQRMLLHNWGFQYLEVQELPLSPLTLGKKGPPWWTWLTNDGFFLTHTSM